MSPVVISDPVVRRRAGKSKGSSILSMPVILIMICSVGGLPPVSSRLWALDTTLHAHNDAIVAAIMAIAPWALVLLAAFGLFVAVRSSREPEA